MNKKTNFCSKIWHNFIWVKGTRGETISARANSSHESRVRESATSKRLKERFKNTEALNKEVRQCSRADRIHRCYADADPFRTANSTSHKKLPPQTNPKYFSNRTRQSHLTLSTQKTPQQKTTWPSSPTIPVENQLRILHTLLAAQML